MPVAHRYRLLTYFARASRRNRSIAALDSGLTMESTAFPCRYRTRVGITSICSASASRASASILILSPQRGHRTRRRASHRRARSAAVAAPGRPVIHQDRPVPLDHLLKLLCVDIDGRHIGQLLSRCLALVYPDIRLFSVTISHRQGNGPQPPLSPSGGPAAVDSNRPVLYTGHTTRRDAG